MNTFPQRPEPASGPTPQRQPAHHRAAPPPAPIQRPEPLGAASTQAPIQQTVAAPIVQPTPEPTTNATPTTLPDMTTDYEVATPVLVDSTVEPAAQTDDSLPEDEMVTSTQQENVTVVEPVTTEVAVVTNEQAPVITEQAESEVVTIEQASQPAPIPVVQPQPDLKAANELLDTTVRNLTIDTTLDQQTQGAVMLSSIAPPQPVPGVEVSPIVQNSLEQQAGMSDESLPEDELEFHHDEVVEATSTEAAATESATETSEVQEPCLTVHMSADPKIGAAIPGQTPIAFLNADMVNYNLKLQQFGDFSPYADEHGNYSVPFRKWFSGLFYGSDCSAMPLQSVYDDTTPTHASQSTCTKRPGSKWVQRVEHEGSSIGVFKSAYKPAAGDPRLVGDAHMEEIQNSMGMGATISVPLWHSGVWLTLKAPSETELMLLTQAIAVEKAGLGYETGGAIFSNSTVYLQHHLYEFIVKHTVNANIAGWNVEQKTSILGQVISQLDLQWLAQTQALTIYPAGYTYEYSCLEGGPDKCLAVTKALINLARLMWVDRTALTPHQVAHMADRRKVHTIDSILNYQNQGILSLSRDVKLSDKISLVLKVPRIKEGIDAGFKWISEITMMINDAFSASLPDQQREQVVTQMANVTEMRQYSHMITKVYYPQSIDPETKECRYVDTAEEIEKALSEFSNDSVLVKAFFDHVTQFIDDSTIALVAIPNYSCGTCGNPRADHHHKHPNLVPLDAMTVFFTLKDLKLLRGTPRLLVQPNLNM